MSQPDDRCCGSGVCIINDSGECWCGQVWNGRKMALPSLEVMPVQPKDEKTILVSDNEITKPSKSV
jgi:hypothetical protein